MPGGGKAPKRSWSPARAILSLLVASKWRLAWVVMAIGSFTAILQAQNPPYTITETKNSADASALNQNIRALADAIRKPIATSRLADAVITTAKMGTDAVDSSKIINGAIATAKIAVDAIDTRKILVTGSWDSGKLLCVPPGNTRAIGFCKTMPSGTPPICDCTP